MRYGHLVMSLFCAWVLWETYTTVNGGEVTVRDRPIMAFDTHQECDRVQSVQADADMKSNKEQTSKPDGLIHHITKWPTCLPDTVDPRAPKAK